VDGELAVCAIANRRDARQLQQLNALLYFTAAIRAHRAVKLSHPFCLSRSHLNCYLFIDKPIIDTCVEWPRAYRQPGPFGAGRDSRKIGLAHRA
jgi:hypothetical protein